MRLLRYVLAAWALAACAHAGPLHMHGGSFTPGPPAPDMLATLNTTEARAIDLGPLVSQCSDTELIDLTPIDNSGHVAIMLEEEQTLIAGKTEGWRKNELTNNTGYSVWSDHEALNVFTTTTHADAANATRLNITCSGDGVTTFGGTKVLQIDVAAHEVTSRTYGVETLIDYGGFNLNNLLGSVSDYTVSTVAGSCGAVACSTRWQIWNGHLGIKCTTAGGGTCPVETAGGFPTGNALTTGAFTPVANTQEVVTLIDGARSRTVQITFTFVAHQLDVAPPISGGSWSATNQDQVQVCPILRGARHWGDVVFQEATAKNPTYINLSNPNVCSVGGATRTQYSGGPLPAIGLTTATYYSGFYDPADVLVLPEQPYALHLLLTLKQENIPQGTLNPSYVRITQCNSRDVVPSGNVPGVQSYAANSQGASAFQVDHCLMDGTDMANRQTLGRNNYIVDNSLTNGITAQLCDSMVLGNRQTGVEDNDAGHYGMFDCADGDEFSKVDWNWVSGTHARINTNHPDHAQSDWHSAGILRHGANFGQTHVGNIFSDQPYHRLDCHDYYVNGIIGAFSPDPSCSGATRSASVTSSLTFGTATISVTSVLSPETVQAGLLVNGTVCTSSNPVFIGTQVSGAPNGIGVYNLSCTPVAGLTAPTTLGDSVNFNSTQLDGTFRLEGAQCMLQADGLTYGVLMKFRDAGNICVSDFKDGELVANAAVGSSVNYNTLLGASHTNNLNLTIPPGGSGYSDPALILFAYGSPVSMNGNVLVSAASQLVAPLSVMDIPTGLYPPNPSVVTPNLDAQSATTGACLAHPQNDLAVTWTRKQDWIDAVVAMGSCAGKGALHAVDIRGRKVLDTSALLPNPGLGTVNAVCTTSPVITGPSPGAAGNTYSLSVAGVWTNSPTITHKWAIFRSSTPYTPAAASTSTSYVLASGDLAHGGGTYIEMFEISTLPDGSVNACPSNQITGLN